MSFGAPGTCARRAVVIVAPQDCRLALQTSSPIAFWAARRCAPSSPLRHSTLKPACFADCVPPTTRCFRNSVFRSDLTKWHRRSGTTGAPSLDARSQQLVGLDSECDGEPLDVVDCDVARKALHMSHESAVQAAFKRQRLLRPAVSTRRCSRPAPPLHWLPSSIDSRRLETLTAVSRRAAFTSDTFKSQSWNRARDAGAWPQRRRTGIAWGVEWEAKAFAEAPALDAHGAPSVWSLGTAGRRLLGCSATRPPSRRAPSSPDSAPLKPVRQKRRHRAGSKTCPARSPASRQRRHKASPHCWTFW